MNNPNPARFTKRQMRVIERHYNEEDAKLTVNGVTGCLLLALISTVSILGIIKFAGHVSHKNEIKQCYELKKQSLEYPHFYLLDWQKEMCDTLGVEIDAQTMQTYHNLIK